MSGDLSIELELKTEEAEQRVAELKGAVSKIGAGGIGTEKFREAAAALAAAREQAEKLRAQIEAPARARKSLLEGIGGEELPEKFNKITEAFKLWGDSSQTMGVRLSGLVGGIGLTQTSLMSFATRVSGVAGAVVGLAQSFVEFEQQAVLHARTVGSLGDAYALASAAASGFASAEEVLSARETVFAQGRIATTQQLGELTAGMRGYAAVTGNEAAGAQTAFLQAVQQSDAQALARFGVRLTETQLRTHDLGAATAQLNAQWHENAGGTDVLSRAWTGLKGAGQSALALVDESVGAAQRAARASEEHREALMRQETQERKLREAMAIRLREQHALTESGDRLRAATYGQTAATTGDVTALTRHRDALRAEADNHLNVADALSALSRGTARHYTVSAQMDTGGRTLNQTLGELAKTQALLDAATHSAAYAQSQMNFQLREGETAAQQYARRLEGAKIAAELHRAERLQNRQIGRDLRRAGVRDADNPFAPSGGGGPGRAEIREATRETEQALAHLGLAGMRMSEGLMRVGTEVGRAPLQHLRDYERELEAFLGHRMPEMIRHGGETQTAFLLRQVQAARGVIGQMTQEYEADRQAVLQRQRDDEQDDLDRDRAMYEARKERERREVELARDRRFAQDDINAERIRLAETNDFARQSNLALAESFHTSETAAQGAAGVLGGAVNTMTGAFKSHFAAVLQGRESAGDALKAWTHEVLLNIASESAVQAIFETAKGLAKVAGSWGTDPSAYTHFASAGMYAAVAVAAGLGAVATAPAQAAAGASAGMGGGSPRASSAVPPSNNSQQQPITYAINISAMMVDEHVEERLSRALDSAVRGGRGPQFLR